MSESDQLEQYTITAESTNPTQTAVQTRGFEFIVDEPIDAGGTNQGPTPVEYLIGSWAGCLNVVGHLVAEEHDIEIDGLELKIEGDLNPAKFTGSPTDDRAGFQELQVTITADTNADESTLEQWVTEVENRCPVGDNIANPTPTEITVTTE